MQHLMHNGWDRCRGSLFSVSCLALHCQMFLAACAAFTIRPGGTATRAFALQHASWCRAIDPERLDCRGFNLCMHLCTHRPNPPSPLVCAGCPALLSVVDALLS